ncbi:MAG: N-acyl homoserine lactonase family protein, partial [Pseudomonadota bacterium]|nr:N-acyl homoserine lactonase family protein [Pseudomonadota bacterium]
MSDDVWEAYALKYGEMSARSRNSNFVGGDDHAVPMPMDFFIWVLRRGERTILIDTGFDRAEAAARGR